MEKGVTKTMDVLQSMSLRELVSQVNSFSIKKEDIVQLIRDEEGFFLVYYK